MWRPPCGPHSAIMGRGPSVGDSPVANIRQATPADIEALMGLLAGGALTTREVVSDLEPYRAALADINASEGNEVLVATVDGQVVGMCQLIVFRHLHAVGGLCAELESVHVASERRSGGIGSQLVEAAVERAAQRGCYRVQLTSNRERTAAQRFYVRHGFTPSHVGFKRLL